MFSSNTITTFTGAFSEETARLKRALDEADAILIGAGAGLSTAAGLTYSGERFDRYFSDFRDKYGIRDMYSGGFYPFSTQEEYWAWWSRHIFYNRYAPDCGKPYADLMKLVGSKDYFVLTTNVDHQFQKSGFDKQRLFYTQGDYGLFQCTKPCRQETFDNEAQVSAMLAQQKGMKIPSELVPRCPYCGRLMTVNLRSDSTFVQDAGWDAACARYEDFLEQHQAGSILYLELGVGGNTPGIIKYPFWQMTAKNPAAVYACVNQGEAFCPDEIRGQSICIDGDIGAVLDDMVGA